MAVVYSQIKSPAQIKKMREAGKCHAELIERVREFIKIGVTTYEIDQFAEETFKKLKLIPAQVGYEGYPSVSCVGINDDAVHCIPAKNPKKTVKNGDLVTFDTIVELDGWHADGGFTVGLGNVDKAGLKLIKTTEFALKQAIESIKPGREVKVISKAIHKTATKAGFNPIKRFAGHGLGQTIHEPPSIPNYPWNGPSPKLKAGMVLALDTMICEGKGDAEFLKDGWSTKLADGKRFAFFEHTVVVTDDGAQILTKK